MSRSIPSILVAGVSSGCGKTTVTLGLMAALRDRGMKVQPFKCGPDFIDPSLHRMVTGRNSWNLDIRMCGRSYVKRLFSRKAAENGINVVEGVMGLYDGGEASSASLARLLGIPVILVVDASSAAESIAAVIRGFESLAPDIDLSGIILNRIASPRHLDMIRAAASRYCRSAIIGAVPRDSRLKIPSRHLGLLMGDENPLGRDFSSLSVAFLKNVDMEAVIRMGRRCRAPGPAGTSEQGKQEKHERKPQVTLGVARDRAFCFYYQDNLEILEQAGAGLVPFSPLSDKRLPGRISGLYLGGGYPELFAGALSENLPLREEILRFSRQGRPLFAECGGFMYLNEAIRTVDGGTHEMVGAFPATSSMQDRLASLGYRNITIKSPCPLGDPGGRLFGHEFHYSRTSFSAPVEQAFQLENGKEEGFMTGNTLAGYIHLHLGRSRQAAGRFVEICRMAGPWRN